MSCARTERHSLTGVPCASVRTFDRPRVVLVVPPNGRRPGRDSHSARALVSANVHRNGRARGGAVYVEVRVVGRARGSDSIYLNLHPILSIEIDIVTPDYPDFKRESERVVRLMTVRE